MTDQEFEVTVDFIKAETAAAYLVVVDDAEVWLAKSQILNEAALDPGDTDVSVVVPRWLAEQNGWA